MPLLRPQNSAAYLSPQHSPELGFGSPLISRSGWKHRCQELQLRPRTILSSSEPCEPPIHPLYHVSSSLPSPPQHHEPSFASADSEYGTHTVQGSPLSPPASDGIMSPPINDEQEFSDKSMDPNMWMPNSYTIKTEDGRMPTHERNSQSPPTLFIEDILREDHQSMQPIAEAYLDENGYGMSQINNSLKRDRNDFMLPPPYQGSQVSTDSAPSHRSRKKRHLTDASEANFHCGQCGKLFSRVWNYNAHLDTHNPDRPRPHVCPEQGCGKSFVRRTDLTRHTQCVHAKDKKFKCELCHNMFARKDTLRRHEDDGCPKRVDIVSRHSKHKPLIVQSQALSYYLSRRDTEQQQFYFPQFESQVRSQQYESSLSSCLPPLSDIVSIQKTSW